MPTIYDAENKLWSNPEKQPLDKVKASMSSWILKALSTYGSKVLQINDDTGFKTTGSEIRVKAIRVVQNLERRGFKSRQMFCFLAKNSDHLLPTFLATILMNCSITPLHAMLSKDELVNIFKKVKPVLVFSDATSYDQLLEALKEMQMDKTTTIFTFGDRIEGVEPVMNLFKETGEEDSFVPITPDFEDSYVISCSSGTTGPSKCVPIHYSAFIPVEYEANSVFFTFDTIFWSIGIVSMLNALYSGATAIITAKPYSPELTLKIIEKYKVTIIWHTAYHMLACLKHELIGKVDLSSMRKFAMYGWKFATEAIPDLKRYFPKTEFVTYYGLTEIGAISSADSIELIARSGGEVFYGCTVKIVDDDGNRCGPNVHGEICAKTDITFPGYLDDPITTAEAFDSEGFFRTGDIGHFDDDGILVVDGRKKEISKIFFFYGVLIPSQIEGHLAMMSGIEEVCITDVPIVPGAGLPAALVVLQPESNLTKQEIYSEVEKNFANRLKLRGGVYFVESIPKTKTGKFIRQEASNVAANLFKEAKKTDPQIQTYLKDISGDAQKFI